MKALIIAEHAAAAAELVAGARTMADEVVAISFGGAYECGADKDVYKRQAGPFSGPGRHSERGAFLSEPSAVIQRP